MLAILEFIARYTAVCALTVILIAAVVWWRDRAG